MANTGIGFVSELTPCVRHAAVIGMALAFLGTLAFTPGAQAASTIAIAETLAAATGQDIGTASDVVERLMTASAAATSWALLAPTASALPTWKRCYVTASTICRRLRRQMTSLPRYGRGESKPASAACRNSATMP